MKTPPFFLFSLFLTAGLAVLPLRGQAVGPVAQPAPGLGPFGPLGPVANTPESAGGSMAGSDERLKNGRTVIESDAGASFDNASNSADFTGHVAVHDARFDLTCDKLHVVLRTDRKGMKQVVAIGNVVVTQEKKNDRGDVVKSIGKCGKATYDPATGDVTLEDWPQIQQGINNQIATQQSTVMILNAKGRSRTIGSSRTMIVDQGQKSITP